jgi:hypothetical protein
VRAEEERRARTAARRLDAAVQVSDRGADLRTGVVLVDVEAQVTEI